MSANIPNPILELFAANALPAFIQLPIPTPSQISIKDGAASFNDGFPPKNFLAPTSGGVPPRGVDFNGLLNMITQYCVALQSGLLVAHDPVTSAFLGGYPLGALLAKDSGFGFWLNVVAGNTTDPDTGGAGWRDFSGGADGVVTAVPVGANNDYAPAGFDNTTGFLDLTPTAAASLTGLAAQGNGQTVIITNLSAFNLTLNARNGGSAAANRFRAPFDQVLTQFNSQAFRYSSVIGAWIPT